MIASHTRLTDAENVRSQAQPLPARLRRALLPLPLLCLCGVYLLLFFRTLPYYGVPFDEALGESFLGDRYFAFLTSFDWKHLDFTERSLAHYPNSDHPDLYSNSGYAIKNAHHIWGFGHVLGAATKWLFYGKAGWLNPIDATHAAPGILVCFLCITLFLFCRRYLSTLAGYASVLLLCIHPRFWAHSHFNLKDIPEAVFFALTLLTFFHSVYAQKRRWLVASAILWGMTLGIKANAAIIPAIGLTFLAISCFEKRGVHSWHFTRRNVALLLVLPALSFCFFLLSWPYLLARFPENLFLHIEFLQQRGFEGSPEWSSMPVLYFLTTTPLTILLLASIGVLRAVRSFFVADALRPGLAAALILWTVLPVLRVSVPHANDFDGIRHWIEFIPAMSLLAGLGLDWIIRESFAIVSQQSRKIAVASWTLACSLTLAPVLLWHYQNHPHQYVYFNSLVGGLSGAQQRGMPEATDYWAVSYREALTWLNENAPADSVLYVGVAEHTVFYVKDIWLRRDINLRNIARFDADRVLSQSFRRPVYLLYVTRTPFFPPQVRALNLSERTPVYSVTVDGGLVNAMYRLDKNKL